MGNDPELFDLDNAVARIGWDNDGQAYVSFLAFSTEDNGPQQVDIWNVEGLIKLGRRLQQLGRVHTQLPEAVEHSKLPEAAVHSQEPPTELTIKPV